MVPSFTEYVKKMNEASGSEAKALFDAGAHGAGRQTKKKAALPPDHPESLMDIGPALKDRGYARYSDAPEQIKLSKDAAMYYDEKGDIVSKIIDNLIRQDDNLFKPGDKITEDELIQKLKMLKTKPDAGGYRGGEDVKLVDDDKIKQALQRMVAANSAYKIITNHPMMRGKGYAILKAKRDIRPEEEATTSARYRNPNAAQKEMGIGGTHPVVKQGEMEIKTKIGLFKKELDRAMQTGFGVPLKQAATDLFKAINAMELNSFVQDDRKAQYKALKNQVRAMIDEFAATHGEESLQKSKPVQPDVTFASQNPIGTPMKAPHSIPNNFSLAREWEELTGIDLSE